jgi:hypothetical protein
MFYWSDKRAVIGVLNDYDLSSMKNVPSGRERTGTVPFMALELLTAEAIQGEIEHLYQHDAESFIWMLTWVSLRYDGGNLLDEGPGRQFDEWLTVGAKGCREKKSDFLLRVQRHDSRPHRSTIVAPIQLANRPILPTRFLLVTGEG